MIDELPVPDRLEDPVREAKGEHVLDRLLAEVMVDPEDLLLFEEAVQLLVQRGRRRSVAPEWLLDDQPRPAVGGAPLADLLDDLREGARRHGEVVDAVARAAAALVELDQHLLDAVHAGLVREVGGDVTHPLGKRVPDVVTERVPRELLHRRLHPLAKRRGRLLRARHPDDPELLGQQAAQGQRIEGGEELALRQVAGGPEDRQHARLGRPAEPQALEKRVLGLDRRHGSSLTPPL